MEHKTFHQLERAGDVTLALPLTRAAKLARWAEALERRGPAPLPTLWRTEYALQSVRATMRADDSPIAVAYADPVLRAAGLADDSYGEAKRFFAISDAQLHWLVCYCHHGVAIRADAAARHVRRLASGGGGWFARLFG